MKSINNMVHGLDKRSNTAEQNRKTEYGNFITGQNERRKQQDINRIAAGDRAERRKRNRR
jgi:hypothetical protein